MNAVRWMGLGLVVTACTTEPYSAQRVPIGRVGVELERALCEQAHAKCGCDLSGAYTTEDSCGFAVSTLVSNLRNRLDQLDAEELIYDGDCVGAYVERLNELGCSTRLENPFECQPPCQFVHGSRALGEACEVNGLWVNDCISGLECVGTCSDPCEGSDVGRLRRRGRLV